MRTDTSGAWRGLGGHVLRPLPRVYMNVDAVTAHFKAAALRELRDTLSAASVNPELLARC